MTRLRWAAACAVVLLVLTACSAPAAPPSFDPGQPCAGAAEQKMAGAYPDLEATVPSTLAGEEATVRESGRYCSADTLGKLVEAGIGEVHFGAATWDRGSGKALSLVTFEATGLTDQAIFDSYVAGATANAKIHDLATSAPTLGDGPGHRLDFLNGDSSFQRILVWPGDGIGRVRVVLAADLLDVDIQAAVDAFH
ncbi:MAG: hypothetical protein ACXWWR_04505 [Candidatus Limnocylindrales bacterium]